MHVCVGLLSRCVMTSLGFHVLVRQSGSRDTSAGIFYLIEMLHKWSCQAVASNRIHKEALRNFLGQQWEAVSFSLHKYSAWNAYRSVSGQSSELPWTFERQRVKNSNSTKCIVSKRKAMFLTDLVCRLDLIFTQWLCLGNPKQRASRRWNAAFGS